MSASLWVSVKGGGSCHNPNYKGNIFLATSVTKKLTTTILNQNQQKEAANNVFEMAALIDGMGKRREQVTEELSSVRKQLEKMEQEKADKTLKATVRKAVDSLEQQCQKMKQQLFEIKTEVKAKASEIVAETKAKGKAALHKVSEFLGIKNKLESVRDNVRKSIAETEHTINKLDAFGSGMREAGQKIANTFRTFADKETVDYSEKEKKFSKIELLKKPFEAKKKLYQRMEQHLDEALDKVERLAKEPERMTDVEMTEPSMLGTVAEPEFQYGADAFEAYRKMQGDKMQNVKGMDNLIKRAEKSR